MANCMECVHCQKTVDTTYENHEYMRYYCCVYLDSIDTTYEKYNCPHEKV